MRAALCTVHQLEVVEPSTHSHTSAAVAGLYMRRVVQRPLGRASTQAAACALPAGFGYSIVKLREHRQALKVGVKALESCGGLTLGPAGPACRPIQSRRFWSRCIAQGCCLGWCVRAAPVHQYMLLGVAAGHSFNKDPPFSQPQRQQHHPRIPQHAVQHRAALIMWGLVRLRQLSASRAFSGCTAVTSDP